ncbi:MAG: magnesium transporter [Bacillales bacterium]|jgi:magnesium transporter|nr:magnesium transporter [Bacillales bacterium]
MIKDLLENVEQLKSFLLTLHPYDIAQQFKDLNEDEIDTVLNVLDDDTRNEVLVYLEAEDAADIIEDLSLAEKIDILEHLQPDDASDIIQELDEDDQKEILEALDNDSDLIKLNEYEDNEAGSVMNPNILIFNQDIDVALATKNLIKEAPKVENISIIYVTDFNNRYLGAVPLKRLLVAKSPLTVKEIVEEVPFVYDTDNLTLTSKALKDYDLIEIPVVNTDLNLLGVVTLDDAIDTYQEEIREDYAKLAALPNDVTEAKVFSSAFHRLPWLVILLLLSFPIALVTSAFEDTLAQIAILMIFTPLILDASGDVATQTLAITLKMLATEERGLFRSASKEIWTGFFNGLIMGVIAFLASLLFATINPSLTDNPFLLSFIVGISLWVTVFAGPIIGFLVPLSFKAMKIDAAVASGPFITSLIDIVALLIYFGLATLLLGAL